MTVIKPFFIRLLPLFLLLLLTSCSGHKEPVHVQLLSINDFHGNLNTTGELNHQAVGGAPYLASYIQQQRTKAPTFLIHAGDLVGGSPPLSALQQDEPSITFANRLNFDLATVGNHEGAKAPPGSLLAGCQPIQLWPDCSFRFWTSSRTTWVAPA